MRLSHDEIREMLPDYQRAAIPEEIRDLVETHLRVCEDCMAELSLITEMTGTVVPDPGELFFKTLPMRVRASVKEQRAEGLSLRALLFRPLPVAATIAALLIAVVLFTLTKKRETPELDPYFKDPFTVAVLDYGGITERDIPLTEERIPIDELLTSHESSMGYSYHREFASLSSEEMESLYEALRKEQKTGTPGKS